MFPNIVRAEKRKIPFFTQSKNIHPNLLPLVNVHEKIESYFSEPPFRIRLIPSFIKTVLRDKPQPRSILFTSQLWQKQAVPARRLAPLDKNPEIHEPVKKSRDPFRNRVKTASERRRPMAPTRTYPLSLNCPHTLECDIMAYHGPDRFHILHVSLKLNSFTCRISCRKEVVRYYSESHTFVLGMKLWFFFVYWITRKMFIGDESAVIIENSPDFLNFSINSEIFVGVHKKWLQKTIYSLVRKVRMGVEKLLYFTIVQVF